ncbi:MAG: TlpA family protein disulfide reductase [Deltaproteobacteria bacterium]|nr:MAG: TlpA family protein disulfide reductase [Deltaproteobacteria bacterium]
MNHRHLIAILLFLVCAAALAGPERLPAGDAEPRAAGAATSNRPADFALPSLDGGPIALNRYLGKKPVLLVFWATWCPECRAAIPSINALHAGPTGKKVQILAIDFRESREKVSATVKARDIRYTVLLDEKGKVARAYGIVGIPTFVLIDRDGAVAYVSHALPDDFSPWI